MSNLGVLDLYKFIFKPPNIVGKKRARKRDDIDSIAPDDVRHLVWSV